MSRSVLERPVAAIGAALQSRTAPIALAAILATLSFVVACEPRRGLWDQSEMVALPEARAMVRGEHSYGIVGYTHFPNGPTYVMAAMVWLGMDLPQMRRVPIVVAGLSVGFMLWALLTASTSAQLRLWTALAAGILVVQPGIANWQARLHEYSYVVSLGFVAIGACTRPLLKVRWLLVVLGFVAGWTGYDWLPGQTLTVFVVRWLTHGGARGDPVGSLARATLDALAFSSGASLAILMHVIQLGLYHGSFEAGLRDLLGAAATHLGHPSAAGLNPEYYETLRESRETTTGNRNFSYWFGAEVNPESPGRIAVVQGMLRIFVSASRAYGWLLLVVGLAGGAALAVDLRARVRSGRLDRHALRAQGLAAAGAVVAAGLASVAWMLLMPRHSMVHSHIHWRHFFIGLALLVAIPILTSRSQAELREPPAGKLPTAYLIHSLFPVLVLLTFAYAALALR